MTLSSITCAREGAVGLVVRQWHRPPQKKNGLKAGKSLKEKRADKAAKRETKKGLLDVK